MCNLCDKKVGNRYADQLPTYLRRVVDAAREACNSPRLPDERLQHVIGGIAIAAKKQVAFSDDVFAQPIFGDTSQVHTFTTASAQAPCVAILAFETLDNSWPDAQMFHELNKTASTSTSTAIILRVMHKNGDVQIWDLKDVLSHFDEIGIAA